MFLFNTFEKFGRLAKPILIVGSGHTGTTLLACMFGARSDTYIPNRETGAFMDPSRTRRKLRKLLRQYRATECRYFAEKTPRHVYYIDPIRRSVPNVKFVAMMRDGRDVAASFIKRSGKWQTGWKRWEEAALIIKEEAVNPDVFLLRYEDLVADPGIALRKLCSDLEMRFDPDMLRFHELGKDWSFGKSLDSGASDRSRHHRALRAAQMRTPLFDGRGKWLELLPPEAKTVFKTGQTGALMRHFGYLD